MLPSEDVALAVFALLDALKVGSPPLVVTTSRVIQPAAQVPADAMPAIFQVQNGFVPDPMTRQLGGMVARIMMFEWFVYVAANPTDANPASTALNQIVDAAVNQIPVQFDDGSGAVPFTVDTVPCPIWWEPDVIYMEAVPGVSNVSIARIEVKVKVPPAFPA